MITMARPLLSFLLYVITAPGKIERQRHVTDIMDLESGAL